MFHDEYVPIVERERLAHEYLSLKQTKELVTEINKMFHERSFFCPEYASLEKVRLTRFFSMLKRDIRELVTNTSTFHWLSCSPIPGGGRSSWRLSQERVRWRANGGKRDLF